MVENKMLACLLPDLGLLSVTGDKAYDLLQGQMTCDMADVSKQQASLGAFCNLQGRIIALVTVIQVDVEHYHLSMPLSVIDSVLAQLDKVAPFFMVKLENITEGYTAIGLIGELWQEMLVAKTGLNSQLTHQSVSCIDKIMAISYHYPSQPRAFLCWLSKTEVIAFKHKIEKTVAFTHSRNWALFEILAGVCNIVSKTANLFLPQILRLHDLGGLSFTKGCYLGQEIIARSYYKGNTKKQLFLARIETQGTIAAGCEIFDDSGMQMIGHVIRCINSEDDNATIALLVLRSTISINSASEAKINNIRICMKLYNKD